MSCSAPSAGRARSVVLHPIGVVRTAAQELPRHWSVSDVEGTLEIDPEYARGLAGMEAGQRLVVLFHFDRSPPFTADHLMQTPPHVGATARGVFDLCSPVRPNPIGLSVVEILDIEGCRIRVRGLDMLDGTPILDLKPHIEAR